MSPLEFYERKQEPFSSAPLPRFYFESRVHEQALARLFHVIERMRGLALLVGEVGTGKTTLARRLLDALPEAEYEAALLVVLHADVTAGWLLRRVALSLGVESPAEEKLALLAQLYRRLVRIQEQGKKAVVLVDEAQMLSSRELLEELRGLLNLELPGRKLLSIVLFGQPELERNLRLDPALAQRVAMRVVLGPLDAASTEAYVRHRLGLAGAARAPFTAEAVSAIHRLSGGTPRIVNTLCDVALFEGAAAAARELDGPFVERVAAELGLGAARGPGDARAAELGEIERYLDALAT